MSQKAIALIPARSGSKRVPGKNVKPLAGHPLMAYSIAAALSSQVFEAVFVSTDSEEYAQIARHYGAEVPFLRPSGISGDTSWDVEWVEVVLNELRDQGRRYDVFSILRPTSPFRRPETIQRAMQTFLDSAGIDSLRAVEKCRQHPGKMWVIRGNRMTPLLPFALGPHPWHSTQTQALPEVFVQNASLEIAWTRVIAEDRSISGAVVMPFLTEGYEGVDINLPEDWTRLENLIASGLVQLPSVPQPAWSC